MTTKDTADRTGGAIDFTMMYVTHDAFRRDLGRFTAVSAAGTARAPGVRAGWENFKAQLLLHHSVEDTHLWPRVRRAAAGRPADLALLDEMAAEHAQIDPLLAAVDSALADSASNPAAHIAGLTSALEWHLKHEEDAALPLIQSVCTPADWRAFAGEMRRRQGVRGAAIYVPWILDGTSPDQRRRFLAALPAPVRLISGLLWESRYRQRGLWKT
jgi:Hemerythrin HHE cation binding domain